MKKAQNIALLFSLLLTCQTVAQTVFINEIMSKNQDIIDEDGEQEDWVELYNAGENSINLEDWTLSDDIEEPDKYVFPEGVSIPAGQFIILWADRDEGPNHLPFKLSANGEDLALFRPNGNDLVLEDWVDFPQLLANVSYGRSIDGGGVWQKYTEYSPNASNINNRLYYTATVDFSLPAGFYPIDTYIDLQTSASTLEIRYTTDGTRPNANSLLYSNPLLLENSVLISAAAIGENGELGLPTERFYHIDNQHNIPVVHLQTEAKNLWDNQKGIYVEGTNGISGNCLFVERNWNRDWKRKAQFSFFEANGTLAFSEKVDVEISGACSRQQQMKSFKIELEEGRTTQYPIFPQLPFTEYRSFKLRNSGSDFTKTMFRDGVLQEALRTSVDLDLMAYRPVILYLNGAYFGVYNLREIMDKDYITQHFGEQEIDMIRDPWMPSRQVKEGDATDCDALNTWMMENDLTIAENYDFFQKNVDVNQMINYWVAQMYFANYDWPGNNMMMWRNRNEPNAQWRFMLFDLDLSSNYLEDSRTAPSYNSLRHALAPNENDWPNSPPSTLWFRKLIENPLFLQELAQRHLSFGQLIFAPERMQSRTDSLAHLIRSEMPQHIDFWNSAPSDWYYGAYTASGGSGAAWEEYLEQFNLFFAERFPFVVEHYRDELGLEETFKLHLNFDENTGGKLVLHDNKMQTPNDYVGQYFKNLPIRIEAIADSGYVFVKWKELDSRDAVLSFVGAEDQVLTPIFVNENDILLSNEGLQWSVYPTLATDFLNLEIASSNPSNLSIEIVDALGKSVLDKQIDVNNYPETYTFDISHFLVGVYFVCLSEEKGKSLVKFVVQR